MEVDEEAISIAQEVDVTTTFVEDPIPESPLGKCRLLINELSSESIALDSKEFIELIRLCESGGRHGTAPLHNFVVLIINGNTREVVFVADLDLIKLQKRGNDHLFVVGSPHVENVDMRFDSSKVQRVSDTTIFDVLPNGQNFPHAIILLKMTKKQFLHFRLKDKVDGSEGQKTPLKLNAVLIGIIKSTIQDMIVYGQKLLADHCNIFEEIHNKFSTRGSHEYVVRDWADEYPNGVDRSINRCVSHSKPLNPYVYKIGEISPGAPNNCDEAVEFIVSQRIGTLGILDSTNILSSRECVAVYASSSSYASISSIEYQSELGEEIERSVRSCRPGSNPELDIPLSLQKLTTLDQFIANYKGAVTKPWDDDSHITPLDEEFVSLKLSHLFNVKLLDNKEFKTSIIINRNILEPEATSFTCRVCNNFFQNRNRLDRPSGSLRTHIMTETGYRLSSNKKVNSRYMKAHLKNRVHLDAWDYVREQLTNELKSQAKDLLRDLLPPRERYWAPTEKLFDWVIYLTKANIPLERWPSLLDKASNDGVLMGHLFRNKISLNGIQKFIAQRFHIRFCNTFVQNNQPFSLILDSTSSKSNDHVVVIYFQTTRNANIETKFYALARLGSDLSGLGHWNTLINLINKESSEFIETFKRNLVGVACDGASNMVSSIKGFIHHAQQYVKHPLLHTWCMAHRINLVGKTTIHNEDLYFFKENAQIINQVARQYSSGKLWADLQASAKNLGRTVRKPKGIKTIRWVPFEYRAIGAHLDAYDLMVQHFIARKASTKDFGEFTALNTLILRMTDKNFVTGLFFIQATNAVLTEVTLLLQKQHRPMVDSVHIRAKIIKSFNFLSNLEESFYIKNMLDQSVCPDRYENKCTLQDYMSDTKVIFKGVELWQGEETQQVELLKSVFIETVLKRIDVYFPSFQIDMFSLFVPENIPMPEYINDVPTPESLDKIYSYGLEKISYFSQFIGSNLNDAQTSLKKDWGKLIETIVSDPNFIDLKKATASMFWNIALLNENYEWTDLSKRLIATVIQQPATSVAAEVFFSKLEQTETNLRQRFKIDTLNAIFNIRHNSVSDVASMIFEIRLLVEEWLLANHCRSDDASYRSDKACEDMIKDNTHEDEERDDEESDSYYDEDE